MFPYTLLFPDSFSSVVIDNKGNRYTATGSPFFFSCVDLEKVFDKNCHFRKKAQCPGRQPNHNNVISIISNFLTVRKMQSTVRSNQRNK